MTISLCITTFNRFDLLIECFAQVIDDPRISEIVIVDDASTDWSYEKLKEHFSGVDKVKLFQNEKNLDCYRNKREAVAKATNEYVILLDSDNIIGKDYIDKIFEFEFSESTILAPSFAKPHFDFRSFEGKRVNYMNVAEMMQIKMFPVMLNAANFFVNRNEYLRVWDGSVDPVTSDSIFFCYTWLKAANSIVVVPGLEYDHRVNDHKYEEGSHYINNYKRTRKDFHAEIEAKLKSMK